MAELTVEGGTFHVEVDGDPSKPVLVLSNSLGTVLSLWDEQMPAFLRHFRVVRYDSRGHGGSHVGAPPYSIDRLGRDVLSIMDGLEIDRAHFLGLSLGGAVGQWLLLNAPDRIERVVLANTAARLGTADIWNARIRGVLAGKLDDNAQDTITRWFGRDFIDRNPDKIEALQTTLRTMSPQGYAGSCAALRDMDLRHAVSRVRHPVLVISGVDDPVTSADDIAILAAMPNAQHVVLAARHVSNVEAPAAFNEAAVRFLTSAGKARSGRASASPRKAHSGDRRAGGRVTGAARRPIAKVASARKGPARASISKASSTGKAPPTGKASPKQRSVRATPANKNASQAAKAPSTGKSGTKTAARRTTAPKKAVTAPAQRRLKTRSVPKAAAKQTASAAKNASVKRVAGARSPAPSRAPTKRAPVTTVKGPQRAPTANPIRTGKIVASKKATSPETSKKTSANKTAAKKPASKALARSATSRRKASTPSHGTKGRKRK